VAMGKWGAENNMVFDFYFFFAINSSDLKVIYSPSYLQDLV